jgi:hypothetical protein
MAAFNRGIRAITGWTSMNCRTAPIAPLRRF